MENHGINMKGKYFMEAVSAPGSDADFERRLIYNTNASGNINGTTDSFGAYKMFFHNNTKWLRPLCGNVSDGPDQDSQRDLGSDSVRFRAMYSDDYYGQVRYS